MVLIDELLGRNMVGPNGQKLSGRLEQGKLFQEFKLWFLAQVVNVLQGEGSIGSC
jgi:hypothetical protein